MQVFPLLVRQAEVGQRFDVARDAPVPAPLLAAEEDRAGLATTDELPAGRLEQMRVLGRQREPAELAVLGGRALRFPHELPERRHRVASRRDFRVA